MLTCIHAAGGAVCAAGSLGMIHLYLPRSIPEWHQLTGKPRLLAVAVSSPTLIVAVGAGGAVWRWNGRRWDVLPQFTSTDLCAVAIVDQDDFLVGAIDGRLWRTSGAGRPLSLSEPDRGVVRPAPVRAVLANPGELWTGGGNVIQRLQGPRQTERWELAGLEIVTLADAGEAIYAVGRGGMVARLRAGFDSVDHLVASGELAGAACGSDGTLYVICGRELRSLSVAGWRVLFEAPTSLSAVACDAAGALWCTAERAVYRHLPDPAGVVTRFANVVVSGRCYSPDGGKIDR